MEAPEGCPQIIYNLMKDVSIIESYRNVSRDLDIPAVDLVFIIKYDQQSYYIKFHFIMFTIITSVQLYDSAQLMSNANLNFNCNFQAWELEPDKRPTFVEARDILEKFKIQNPQ